MNAYLERIRDLNQTNEYQAAYIKFLESELGINTDVPMGFDFTPNEKAIFGALFKRKICSKESLMHTIYGLDPDCDRASERIVDVYICRIRQKLKLHKIEIMTAWAQGYYLTQENKDKVQAILNAEKVKRDNFIKNAGRETHVQGHG